MGQTCVDKITWSATQLRRLKELAAAPSRLDSEFQSAADRDAAFQELSEALAKRERQRLLDFGRDSRRPRLCRLESLLAEELIASGFSQVSTPIIMSRGHLAKMTITADHPLNSQVFWIDKSHCLRPMLAPHLYCMLRNLLRVWEKPVQIFEIGPCFRRESGGAQHASEFTMLNLVVAGLPMEERLERLQSLSRKVAELAGVRDSRLESTCSEVYGETIDVVSGPDRLEVGSAAMGPHPLDRAWRIADTWVGIGFGLERLIMAAEQSSSLGRWGRSISYLDGIRLNI
jgi:pyrrolysyl-tRNA synthetase-like protein